MTLLKSTLLNLPIYFMSIFETPHKASLRLKKIHRDFFLGGGELQRKPYLVSWLAFGLDKKEEALEVRKLPFLNKALLWKWCCRFSFENDSSWK